MGIVGVLLALFVGAVSAFTTRWVLRRATALNLVQFPNERSSHDTPTPSGGGLGFVVGGTIGALPFLFAASGPAVLVVALSLCLAAIGFVDDRRPVAAHARLATQLILVTLLLGLGVALTFLGASLGLPMAPWIAVIVAVPLVVYWVNLFNFMDGIDGLAASQALFMLAAAAGLAFLGNPYVAGQPLFWWMIAVAAAVAAFLFFNWAPAKIFMGDAGSTYLGFMLAVFALATAAPHWLAIEQWLILAALFITDASITLIRRFLRGERVMQAHRRHAYQVQARRFGSHRVVTLIYAAVNLVWLLPMAFAVSVWRESSWTIVFVAYLPLIVLAPLAGAGKATDA